MLNSLNRTCRKGFTLSELLIALVILGVIATFVIPKVLQVMQNQQKQAILKETVATVYTPVFQAWQKGEVYPGADHWPASMDPQYNAVKICADSLAEGCWTQPVDGGNWPNEQRHEHGFLLHNGATVTGIDSGFPAQQVFDFMVDWNGVEEPNLLGEDQLALSINIDKVTVSGHPAGSMWPSATSKTLFESLFMQ